MRWAVIFCFFLLVPSLRALAIDPVFSGTVIDAHGKPVEGAEVCGQWGPVKPGNVPRCLAGGVKTDVSGHFSMTPSLWSGELALLVFDAAHKTGAQVSIQRPDFNGPARIELRPLQPVHYLFVSPSIKPDDVAAHFYTASHTVLGFLFGSQGDVLLPPGTYEMKGHAPDSDWSTLVFEVRDRSLTLKPLHFKLSAIAAHYGKGTPVIAPMVDFDHHPFTVGSIKGQWTLLYFWENGCIPCIEHGFPELIAFTKSHNSDATHLRILAVHTRYADSKPDWDGFHKNVTRLEGTLWHDLPTFPMLYDESSRTTTNWGIAMWPTYALIDPHGNLVRAENFADVEAKAGIH